MPPCTWPLQADLIHSRVMPPDIDIDTICPAHTPPPLKQPANFCQLVACSLQAEAGVPGAEDAIESLTLSCTSGEADESTTYDISIQVQMGGSGMMAMTFEFSIKLPLHKKADAETRQQLGLDALRQQLQAQVVALQQRVEQLEGGSGTELLVLLREDDGAKLLRLRRSDPILMDSAAGRVGSGGADFPWDIVAGADCPIQLTKMVSISTSSSLTDLGALATLPCLRVVDLIFGATDITEYPTDLSFIESCPHLESLKMQNHPTMTDLRLLGSLPFLKAVDLTGCTAVTDLSCLPPTVMRLAVTGCIALVQLPTLKNLESILLTGCTSLVDISPVSVSQIKTLNLTGLTSLVTLPTLKSLESITLTGCTSVVDLSPVSGSQIKALKLDGLTSLVTLPHLPLLARINLAGCPAVRDVTPLVGTRIFTQQYPLFAAMPDCDLGPLKAWFDSLPPMEGSDPPQCHYGIVIDGQVVHPPR